MLLIETSSMSFWKIANMVSIVDCLAFSACCPFSMIPTLYGVRLVAHVQLGSPVCVQLHDNLSLRPIQQLKWFKVHPNFSSNIQMDVSPALKTTIGQLASIRFTRIPRGLYTFYSILQSLFERCSWLQNGATLQSIFQTEYLKTVPVSHHLTWQTEQAWLSGEPVLAYSFSDALRIGELQQHFQQHSSVRQLQLVLVLIDTDRVMRTHTFVSILTIGSISTESMIRANAPVPPFTSRMYLGPDFLSLPSLSCWLLITNYRATLLSLSLMVKRNSFCLQSNFQRMYLNQLWSWILHLSVHWFKIHCRKKRVCTFWNALKLRTTMNSILALEEYLPLQI